MKRASSILALLILLGLVVECSREQSDLPVGFVFEPLPAPSDIRLDAYAHKCILSWSYPPDARSLVSAFLVYRYYVDYGQLYLIATTRDTFFVDSLLVGNLYYCYAVSAIDSCEFEGWRAGPECIFVPDIHWYCFLNKNYPNIAESLRLLPTYLWHKICWFSA